MLSSRLRPTTALVLLLLPGLLVAPNAALAQAPQQLTAADYQRAQRLLDANVNPLVLGPAVRPAWLAGDRFTYRNTVERGTEFVVVDLARRTRGPAFDHAAIALALSRAAGAVFEPYRLPFRSFTFVRDGAAIRFGAAGKNWECDVAGKECRPAAATDRGQVVSPDGRSAIFIRNDNLWLREIATGAERALTTDGVRDFGYATDNAGWTHSDLPVVLWSPDSKKVATFQQDQRQVGEMYLVSTKVGHPTLEAWKYPLPGDEHVATIHRVVIHLDGPRVVRLKMPPDQHRGTITDDIKDGEGRLDDVRWAADSSALAFVSSSRDHRQANLRVANPATGDVRDVLEEKVDTFFESGNDQSSWHFLPASGEVIWFSQRSDWGHLYLYDLATGRVKRPITSGSWNVTQVLKVDEKERALYLCGVGREAGRNPYFRHFYRVGIDTGDVTLLTPEDADHEVALSPSGEYFVDAYSTTVTPPVSVARDLSGQVVMPLEKADITRLQAIGWKPPIPFTVKARDGATDLYGLMFRPTDFDETKRYPIINNIYPGPQTGSIRSRSFLPAHGDAQALAELGFIVVQIDAMGTPWRSKSFHAAYYADMGDNGLPDQVAGMKELAARHPWIDIDRAGVWGHSGGGFASTGAMFRYPDFFKVGVSQAGNHDNRGYEDDWAEKWQGLLVGKQEGASNYDGQANQTLAKNLKGKLLLAHGTMDNNVPPYLTLLVVDELIKANKDFDLIMMPNRRHGFGNEPYMMRRRWDYFVKHLMGAEPPPPVEFPAPEPRR
jgi:dipeptidyl aminopeptidase/acylaminoacyl peptidase